MIHGIAHYRVPLSLVVLALLTRLPLLTISLDEVDSANFVNALTLGYSVPLLRPHPPGYPVYMFLATVLNGLLGDPLLSLSLLSALLGSLTVIPFYLLLLESTGARTALFGTLLFMVNPLAWSFGEAALGDVPAMFFTVLLAWLCDRARQSVAALLWSFLVASLAVGVRPANIAFLPWLLLPLAWRWLVLKHQPWNLAISGLILFAVTTAAWSLPMVFVGSSGLDEYSAAVAKQWSTAVSVYDFTHVGSPWLPNLVFRIERFFYAYFLTFSWTGDDAKTPITLLLVLPWLFGFALFIITFGIRDAKHLLVAIWIASLGYVTLSIHFLPRYGLSHMPGFLMACLIGYRSLGSVLRTCRRRTELLSGAGIACALILYGMKQQPPVGTFEFTPPEGSAYGGLFVSGGLGLLLVLRSVYQRASIASSGQVAPSSPAAGPPDGWTWAAQVGVSLLILVCAVKGFALASIAHVQKSPNQQLVEFAREHFDGRSITPCWDNLTHSSFEALIPGVVPTGFMSLRDLIDAYDSGRTLLITDKCVWYRDLDMIVGLSEVGRFEGSSPLWSKAPSLRLYAAGKLR